MSEHADELADIREKTERGDRMAESEGETTFADRIREGHERVEEGDLYKNITARDENMAVFLEAVIADPEDYQEIIEALAEAAGQSVPEDRNQATLHRMALRAAFSDYAPEYFETAKEAKKEYEGERY